MSASICKVQKILHWFESQRQLTFYASSLLFVYEGLPCSSSSPPLQSTNPAMLSTVDDTREGGEAKVRQEGARQEEEGVAEYNNNNIQVVMPLDYTLASIYTNRKASHHPCSKGHLHGNSGAGEDVETTVSSVNSATCEEDNSAWNRTAESRQPPNGNGNKSQLEARGDAGEREDTGRSREEAELQGGGDDVTVVSRGAAEVEVRMIDFAHVFPSESHDDGYIYGLKHLLTVLEQILCDAA